MSRRIPHTCVSPSARPRRMRARAGLWVVVLLVAVVALAAAGPALAAAAYTGNVTTTTASSYVANDHTPIAFQLAAGTNSGLAASTKYYVKVRFSPVASGQGSSGNRGLTWNPGTHNWVHNSAAWTDFPSITTLADKSLPTDASSWLYGKFADDTQTSAANGPWYLVVSLSVGVAGNTLNPSAGGPLVTVMSMSASGTGSWVHDGVPSGLGADTRVAATSAGASSPVYGLTRTEANGTDDDANGVVDDEDYGQAGSTGDFRLAVPANTAIDVRTGAANDTVVDGWTGVTTGPPDTDIALGASDTTPPTAPGTLSVTPGYRKLHLAWGDASDDTGVTGYDIYRWQGSGTNPTPTHVFLDRVTAASTYNDTDVIVGQTYHYEVRAVDAATNVGPRSNAASGAPQADTTAPTTSAATLPPLPALGWFTGTVTITFSAIDDGSGVASVSYTLDGGDAVVTAGAETSLTLDANGAHALTYWAADNDGNIESAHGLSVPIDAAAPVTTATAGAWHGGTMEFSLSAKDNIGGSGVAAANYQIGSADAQPYTQELTLTDATPVAYWSVDSAGNMESPQVFTPQTDTVAPVTTASAVWAGGHQVLTLSALDDSGGTGVYATYFRIGGGEQQTYSDPITLADATPVTYWSVDNALNVEQAQTFTPETDTTPPTADAGPDQTLEATGPDGASATLTGSAHDLVDPDPALAWYEGDAKLGEGAGLTRTFALGEHTLRLEATDFSGNVGTSTVTVTVLDTTPPTLDAGPDQTLDQLPGAATVEVTMTGTASDLADASPALAWYEGAAKLGEGATLSHAFALGEHALTLVATDASGNSASANVTVTVRDRLAPSVSASPVPDGWQAAPVTVDLTAADNLGGSGVAATEYKLDDADWTAGAHVLIDTEGVHALLYRARDVAGNLSDAGSATVSVDLTAPTVAVSGADDEWHNQPVSLLLTGSDLASGVASLSYRVDGGEWVTGPASMASLTIDAPDAGANDGSHLVEYAATDLVGHESDVQSLTVNIDTSRPLVTAPWAVSVKRGQLCTLPYRVSDLGSPTATVTVRITGSGGRLVKRGLLHCSFTTPSDGRLRYTSFLCNLKPGTYRYTLTARDAAGNPQVAADWKSLRVQ